MSRLARIGALALAFAGLVVQHVRASPPSLPPPPTPFAPSNAALTGSAPFDPHAYADVDTCAGCHAEIAAEWATSAHAFSSLHNPSTASPSTASARRAIPRGPGCAAAATISR